MIKSLNWLVELGIPKSVSAGQVHGLLMTILRLVRNGGSRDDPLRPGAAGVQRTVFRLTRAPQKALPFSYHGITITYL